MSSWTPGSESAKASELDSLERDLPTTAADVEALRRARAASAMSPADIVRTLEQLGTLSPEELRARPLLGGEPFELNREDD